MLTATVTEARRALDQLAIRWARESLTIYDCTGSPERQAEWIQGNAYVHADRLADGGLDPFEAAAVAEHLVKAAAWCLSGGTGGAALIDHAVTKANIILQITNDTSAACQLAIHGALTAAMEQLEGHELEAFAVALQQAVGLVASETAGQA